MRSRSTRVSALLVLVVALFTIHGTAERRYELAPFWTIDPNNYASTEPSPPRFPETGLLPRGRDIGVAFSGGGVRSASATIGELRGLETSKLLSRVQYVSAVSGGSWAVIPWTFSPQQNLLGTYEAPGALVAGTVKTQINGSLATAVQGVSIELAGSKEGALIAWAYQVAPESQGLLNVVRRLLKGASSTDRTYASLLRNTLLKPLGNNDDTDFQLDEAQDSEYTFWNRGPRLAKAAKPQPGRPFMIINADVVNAGADFDYPYAIPFEFTPLYVGSRQSVGGVFGGVYTWPSAYNAATARVAIRDAEFKDYCAKIVAPTQPAEQTECEARIHYARQQGYSGILEYSHDDDHARVSLSDVAASTGAAPLFFIAGGNGQPLDIRTSIWQLGGPYFPQFTHLAIRDGDVIKPTRKWPHADGGARDNLGIAALLARQVKKIIVFVNVDSEDFNNNDDIASLFEPRPKKTTADPRENVMLTGRPTDSEPPLTTIRKQFKAKRDAHQPLVTCGRYDVKANATFNIRAYSDVRVCWVYPERASIWMDLLQADVRAIVDGQCAECGTFANFPWFDTFAENRDLRRLRTLGVLKLTVPQVNLMTNLMAWTVNTSAAELRFGLGIDP